MLAASIGCAILVAQLACAPESVPGPMPTPPRLVATATIGPVASPVPTSTTDIGRPTERPQPSDPMDPAPTVTVPATLTPSEQPMATVPPAPTATPREQLRPDGPPRDPGPLDWAHPGPYIRPAYGDFSIASFRPEQPVVTTYYFYWHDLTNPARQARIKQFWSQRPPNPESYTFLSGATHRKEFEDMQAAGIDFALPVYWGEPGHPGRDFVPTAPHYWSTEGLPPMVEALDAMATAGHPFKIGMFYDTTILANADLTTPAGKEYFYVNVRDYYSRIPPTYWAAIGGKPIVWLYDTQWVAKFDQSSLDYLAERFSQDFGGLRPYVVREWQWYQSKGVTPQVTMKSDNMYAWGAAPSGFNVDKRFGVAEVGPGFSNTRYCKTGLAANCFDVDRENGAFYERELRAALRSSRKILAVETWNEFSEGSDIAETVEFGRTYINLTRTYAAAFHAGRSSP